MARDAYGFDFDNGPGTMSKEEEAEADKKLFVQFYIHPVLDLTLTEGGVVSQKHPIAKEAVERGMTVEPWDDPVGHMKHHVQIAPAGRPIYRDTEFVRISRPGDKLSQIEVPVDAAVIKRFRKRYDNWKAGNSVDGIVGTRLSELRFITPAKEAELAFYNIRTVEQLVAVTDEVCGNFMGLLELRKKAQLWIDNAKGDLVEKVAQDLKEREAEMNGMRQAIADLQSQLAEKGAKPSAPPSLQE